MNRGPDGRFCGKLMGAWLPLLLRDIGPYGPLEAMLRVASHWCHTQVAREYGNAADVISRDQTGASEVHLSLARQWIMRRDVLQEAASKMRNIL